MVDWLKGFFEALTLRGVLLGVLILVASLVVNLAIVSFILVRLPPTYFKESHSRDFWTDRSSAIRVLGIVGKNALGLLLVVLGVLLSLPGVPGQGLLTILLGIMLLDFPGKRRLEYKLVSRPTILKTINSLRHRFGKPPMVLD
jgi:hypothetical protein